MPQLSFPIPLRTSSVNAPTGEMLSTRSSQMDPRARKTNKAQKILGTTDIALDHDYHQHTDRKSTRRPSFLRAPEIKSKKGDGLVLFPADDDEPSPRLRVRASSPLLGQEYLSAQDSQPPVPQMPKKIHQAGSSSALYSHYRSRESPASSKLSFGAVKKDAGLTTDGIPDRSSAGSNQVFKQPKGPIKESKRKSRPPRIDLSLLFPKPQAGNAPLLSPQRMVSSPSPISVTSDHSTAKAGKSETRSPGRKLTKAPPERVATHRVESHQKLNGVLGSPSSYEMKGPGGLDPSMERAIRSSEMDLALERDSNAQLTPRSTDRIRYSLLHFRPRSREQLQMNDSKSIKSGKSNKSSQTTLRNMPSNLSVGDFNRDKEFRKAASGSYSNSGTSSPQPFLSGSRDYPSVNKGPMMSKKSSKSTLRNTDLYKSSVLCLSSSEDEDDEEEEEDILRAKPSGSKTQRDSVATFGEFEAEICTASAAQATKGTLKSVQRPSSTSTRESRPGTNISNTQRDSSTPLAGKPSGTAKGTQSRRSSGIPAIFEPDFFHNDPIFSQMRRSSISQNSAMSQKEYNRRSRLMAVTRQEENLLEAMRERHGKITPSILNESRYNGAQTPDRRSIISGPSRDSFYCSDTSFLRLSPGLPPPGYTHGIQGANHLDRRSSIAHGAVTDGEQRTMPTMTSPRASLMSSSSLPSPATSGASPLTPTLPIHRFSPLPSQKPPPRRPPPPVPDLQKQHSRRRTDSSEAIVLAGGGTPKGNGEFPVWALGWSGDASNVTAVH